MIEAARKYIGSRLSACPAKRETKFPTGLAWKQYQQRIMEPEELDVFSRFDALCIITGEVSGCLEVLDFDDGGSQFAVWQASVEDRDLMARLPVVQTPSGGFHVYYRCPTIEGNLKLARKESGEVLIETRGEGGLIVAPPSDGYTMLQGDLTETPVITVDQRDMLLSASRALDQKPAETQQSAAWSGGTGSQTTPWGDFNQRGDIRPTLEAAGWTKVRDATAVDPNEWWCRPGKDPNAGHSATLDGSGRFFVWSSNVPEFEPNQAYSRFEVFKRLACNNIQTIAIDELKQMGYGQEPDLSWVDRLTVDGAAPADIVPTEKPTLPRKPKKPPMPIDPEELPGFIGDFVRWQLAGSMYPSPTLSFSYSLAMMAALCGRKIQDPNKMRSNIMLLNLADMGVGKDHGRQCIKELLHKVGAWRMVTENIQSSNAVCTALLDSPCLIVLQDEIQAMFAGISSGRAHYFLAQIPEILKMAFSSAKDRHWSAAKYADKKRNIVINQPNLVFCGSGTPRSFWRAMTQDLVQDGFIGRCLMFEETNYPPFSGREWVEPPDSLVEQALAWVQYEPSGDLGDINEGDINPYWIRYTPAALERLNSHGAITRDGLPDDEETPKSLWSRAAEKSKKLAMLFACSRQGPPTPGQEYVINKQDADLGIKICNWTTRTMIWHTDWTMGGGENGRLQDLILDKIPAGKWISKSELTLKTRRLGRGRRDRMDALGDLIDAGEVECELRTETGGRPSTMYRRSK